LHYVKWELHFGRSVSHLTRKVSACKISALQHSHFKDMSFDILVSYYCINEDKNRHWGRLTHYPTN